MISFGPAELQLLTQSDDYPTGDTDSTQALSGWRRQWAHTWAQVIVTLKTRRAMRKVQAGTVGEASAGGGMQVRAQLCVSNVLFDECVDFGQPPRQRMAEATVATAQHWAGDQSPACSGQSLPYSTHIWISRERERQDKHTRRKRPQNHNRNTPAEAGIRRAWSYESPGVMKCV
jgi:hypothetical protein